MMSIRTIAVASSMLLLVSTACSAGQTRTQAHPLESDPQQADRGQQPAVAEQADSPPAGQDDATQSMPATQAGGTAQGTPGQPAGQSGQPSTYQPKTEHDNTPWRFNMQQDGRNMSADEFDAWMKARGVRVATGKPATPLAQNCPTPDGDKGDDDGDGIINCLDACPDSQAGQTIGPDGCPVPVSIDLKGVTFAYDTADLSGEARAVLDEAVEILQRHPNLTVEVAGHTDSRGAAAYNQRLSERRAKTVYDYLVESGIEPSRLLGPKGFGETRPIAPNENPDGSDNPDGRAENRRVELNIQN